MHETNPALAFALAVKHFLAAQERPTDTHMLAQITQPHRRQAHHEPSGESGADPEHRTPWRYLGHRGVDIAVEHLRIVKPGAGETEVLGHRHVFPRIDTRWAIKSEFHERNW